MAVGGSSSAGAGPIYKVVLNDVIHGVTLRVVLDAGPNEE